MSIGCESDYETQEKMQQSIRSGLKSLSLSNHTNTNHKKLGHTSNRKSNNVREKAKKLCTQSHIIPRVFKCTSVLD